MQACLNALCAINENPQFEIHLHTTSVNTNLFQIKTAKIQREKEKNWFLLEFGDRRWM